MARVLYLVAHSVLEHDEVKLLHSLGHEVFSPGSYIHPSRPLDPIRPPIDMPEYPELIAAVDALGQPHPDAPHVSLVGYPAEQPCSMGHKDTLLAAKAWLPDAILDWADTIIVASHEHTWLIPQWERFRGKRVIWRTIGQSGDQNELSMQPLVREGCEVIRYSPAERNIPNYAGQTALIRFGKDPDEWTGWTGDDAIVTNVTQALHRRGDWTGYPFWEAATRGLPRIPMGGESEVIGGTGRLSLDEMKAGLRRARCYLYLGTQPASYTLGLIEAMLTGIPVVSIGPAWMRILPYGSKMFEGHEIAGVWSDDPRTARAQLVEWLDDREAAAVVGQAQQARAREMFGLDVVKAQWARFLEGSLVRELVAA